LLDDALQIVKPQENGGSPRAQQAQCQPLLRRHSEAAEGISQCPEHRCGTEEFPGIARRKPRPDSRDQDRRDEDRDILAPVYGWFTEGFDTPDFRAVKVLLDELVS
jgi:hypothetical protein